MAIEVYNSSISNQLWYTDKCRISTTGTAVTYQVYATALGTATAAGNIYSSNESVGANETKYIYVGVGNYLTITGSGFTAVAIGTATSAQAGTGNFTEQFIAPPAPVVTSGSVLFNATPSQYLTVPNNAAFTQNQAFTIETWFYPTNITGGYIWSMLQVNFLTMAYRSSGKFQIDMSSVGNPPGYTTLATTYPINNWYHVALTWNGTNGRLWINGAQESTFTGAGATVAGGNAFYIGQYQGQGQPTPLGNLSNFRVVKGVAVYTGAFTVPTAPLTATQSAGTNISAITGTQTQLLLNTVSGANFLADSSTNNFTVTNNGAVTSSALTPF